MTSISMQHQKIAINSGQLLLLETKLGTTAADYEAYHAAEKYLDTIAASEQAKKDYQRLDYNIIHHGYTRPQITLNTSIGWALTEVERPVVQRLLELIKLKMSGLTYNLRDKISKASSRRVQRPSAVP
ncbi:hypothetical protein B0H14DRAFT_3431990 [Mycena olivaceomarginata]|nr:hypothetical protein B0H14DRAFT_3431990 [Mycena olivaceomarginata]